MTSFFNSFNVYEDFDLLFKNLFDTRSNFSPLGNSNPKYPVDILETENGLQIDIAVVGLNIDDIEIKVENRNILVVAYEKDEDLNENKINYIHQGIAKRSFKFAWKISPKYNLDKIDASLEKGLLSIQIPIADEAKPKAIEIKSKD